MKFPKLIQNLDDGVWGWLQKNQHYTYDYFCRDFSSLGGSSVVPAVAVFSSILLWMCGNGQQAIVNMVSYMLAAGITVELKKMFSRSSPLPYDPWHTGFMKIRHFPAFPSGHTAMSLFLYLSLAILAAQAWPAYGTYFIGTALVTAGLIGAGKMYLGAHWLSDVVVGYSLGLVYTFVWMRL